VKKFLKIFGVVALLVLGAFATLFLNTQLYDREVSAYANDAILAIATDWNEQALLQRASPELFAASTPQQIHDAFVHYRQLGRMTKYNVARSIAHINREFALVHKKIICAPQKFGCWPGPFLVKGTRLRKVWTRISRESIAP
jgi:hypothetical protein